MAELDEFTMAYIEAALWSSLDERNFDDNGSPLPNAQYPDFLNGSFDWGDFSPETLQQIIADCTKFQSDNAALIAEAVELGDYASREWSVAVRSGHDFWLTRNGHGVGFWDRGLGNVGDTLSEAATAYSEVSIYVGDDGLLYLQ